MEWTVRALAQRLDVDYTGDGDVVIRRVASLASADGDALSFFVPGGSTSGLAGTRAAAVIVAPDDVASAPCQALVSRQPYREYARATHLLHPRAAAEPGVAAGALVEDGAIVDPSAKIGAAAVIERGAVIEADVEVGPGCVIGADARLGADTHLAARVTVAWGCELGQRCEVQSGAVIGSDGFGFAHDGEGWIHIRQLGRVVIGDDVAIGANTTIDRGTLDDTRIERGVILDNLIQIAHNVQIGAYTAMAGCVGVAGSARIGERCTVGGAAGILGHLEVTDDVHIAAMSLVRKSITVPGSYSSGTPLDTQAGWRRNAVRFRQLDHLVRRVSTLERNALEKKDSGKTP